MATDYHVIQTNENLRKIAEEIYDDAGLADALAGYNGIFDPALILVGQTIELPSRDELEGSRRRSIPSPSIFTPPHGLEEILDSFGDIRKYINDDDTLHTSWEINHLTRVTLPFAIPLSWDPSKFVKRLYCHQKLNDVFVDVFTKIEKEGLKDTVKRFGGCYNYRSKRGKTTKLSTHSWGIAIDLNPQTNAMGSAGDMNADVVAIFKEAGFLWGGDWEGSGQDPMHFQFCTGY